MSSETRAVVGRERELDSLERFLDAVPEGPVGLWIEGEVGIGKTTLWKHAAAAARERSYRVLVSRPIESETQLAFAALGDLLEDVPAGSLAGLPEPQQRALEVALLRREAEGPAPHSRAVALGLLGVLRSLAQPGPVVVAVDDVQWLDSPSASALEFVARRLREEPIGLLVAQRREPGDGPALDLERALADDRFERLSVGPLDVEALDRLLRAGLDAQFNRAGLEQLHAASGGNPFFALEIARSVLQREVPLTPGRPLPVPDNLRLLVGERLTALSPSARDVALVVSVLPRATIELAQAAAGGHGSIADLEEAIDAGVLELDGDRVRFAHPLLASVLYENAAAAERRRLHARLAAVLDDPEERAGHLALATQGPDVAVAAELDEAAQRARARGAPDAAATLWEQARRFTPGELAAEARRRGIEAAECHFEAGETERARTLLEKIVATAPRGRDRARALTLFAWVGTLREGFHVGAELFEAALAEVGDDLRLQIDTERGLAWCVHETGDVAAAEARARHALELAEKLGEPGVLASALADMAFHETVRGRGIAFSTIERALSLESELEWRPILGRPGWIHAMLLEWAGKLDDSRATLETLRRSALAHGDEHSVSHFAFHLARVDCLAGNWEQAARYAEECYEAAAQTGESERPYALTIKALVDAHVGLVEPARAATDEGLPLALRLGVLPAYFELLAIRGFLELSLGSAAEAQRFLGPLSQAVREAGFGEPLFRFHGDAIETLLALGRTEEATALLAELEEQGTALQRVWALAVASRCRALLSAAAGEIDRAYDELERAFELHDRLGEPFERGRAFLALGTIQRRARKKRAARESLERALAVFEELGAVLWSEKARGELARIGGRAPASGALTPTEERVAALVAAGRTYREVADALFISPKTVQWNLSKIYRKLGVRSRGELAAKLGTEGGSPRESPSRGGGQSPAVPPVPE
jgi:ATP/maltotriose-dependent transcriptional regulator MalT